MAKGENSKKAAGNAKRPRSPHKSRPSRTRRRQRSRSRNGQRAQRTALRQRRLEEMKDDKGLRRQQKIEQIRKEFEKHPDNPFNQANASYNSTRDDLQQIRDSEKGEDREETWWSQLRRRTMRPENERKSRRLTGFHFDCGTITFF
ncbi:unnamed protein product [Aureobasidium pullulans]|nr:unnamed protein product [Aureobasidium pullulans]